MKKLSILILLLLTLTSCKAQLPAYVSAGSLSSQATATEYIEWYNAIVESPQYDTVDVFRMPSVSDLRYVIIRPSATARVEYTNGRFITWLTPDRQWVEALTFNQHGEVIKGLNPIMISGKDLIVQYERCTGCTFKPNHKGEL